MRFLLAVLDGWRSTPAADAWREEISAGCLAQFEARAQAVLRRYKAATAERWLAESARHRALVREEPARLARLRIKHAGRAEVIASLERESKVRLAKSQHRRDDVRAPLALYVEDPDRPAGWMPANNNLTNPPRVTAEADFAALWDRAVTLYEHARNICALARWAAIEAVPAQRPRLKLIPEDKP